MTKPQCTATAAYNGLRCGHRAVTRAGRCTVHAQKRKGGGGAGLWTKNERTAAIKNRSTCRFDSTECFYCRMPISGLAPLQCVEGVRRVGEQAAG